MINDSSNKNRKTLRKIYPSPNAQNRRKSESLENGENEQPVWIKNIASPHTYVNMYVCMYVARIDIQLPPKLYLKKQVECFEPSNNNNKKKKEKKRKTKKTGGKIV